MNDIGAFFALHAFLSAEMPDTIAGLMLVTVAAIKLIWGVALLIDGFALRSDPGERAFRRSFPWYRPFRYTNFPMALGLFMAFGSIFFGVLGILILKSPSGVLVWHFLMVASVAMSAAFAFAHWAADRLPRSNP
jgi:hypothetical protein